MEIEKTTGPGTEPRHDPVMVGEVLDLLQVGPHREWVDGTLGLGGHARAILEKSSPEGRLLGIDRDSAALKIAGARLSEFASRAILRHGSYDHTSTYLREVGWSQVDGMILDLGLSSFQLEDPTRGFSFLRDSALDMRMDLEEEVTARELLDDLPEKALGSIFREYGEERFSGRIARSIVNSRRAAPIRTTLELCQIVSRAVPFSNSKIHPATRVFQALRIAVNRELSILRNFLAQPPDFLKVGGRLAILSYHSLEDRLVKNAFRSFENYRPVTKKPLRPTEAETRKNPRARSAKLRVLERTE